MLAAEKAWSKVWKMWRYHVCLGKVRRVVQVFRDRWVVGEEDERWAGARLSF